MYFSCHYFTSFPLPIVISHSNWHWASSGRPEQEPMHCTLCSAVQCSAVQCSAVQCSAVQCRSLVDCTCRSIVTYWVLLCLHPTGQVTGN